MKKVLLGILIVLLLLLIPFLTKDRSSLIENFAKISPEELGYSEVSFTNGNDNINIGGILFLPAETDSIPLVIFIHGSGYSSRNNTWYLTLTRHLLNNNIAVLLPDKRGSKKSGGDWKGVPIETLATDTEAAITFAKNLPNTFSKIGVIGMSQGGWVAPVVASKNKVDFVVNVSGSLSSASYQLEFEERHNIGYYTYDFLAKPISKMTVKNLARKPHIEALLDFDPLPFWKEVTVPNLIAYSIDDTNCPVENSLERAEKDGLKHLNIKTYASGGHAISNQEKTDYREDFLNDLITFLK